VLVPATRPVPQPDRDEVLIKVKAAGLNGIDLLQRSQADYPLPPGSSDILGVEVAGEIAALGSRVTEWRVGDSVCALVAGGGYAEYCVAAASLCLPQPHGFDMVKAAALPETVFTVWSNIFELGALRPEQSLLVHGGTSGIGTTAIQLAKARGARVFTTAGSVEKCQVCSDLGADRAVNYHDEDFVKVIKEISDGKGVDVILDSIGGSYVEKNLQAIALGGRIIMIAFLRGSKIEADIGPLLWKHVALIGSLLRPKTVAEKAQIAIAVRKEVWPIIEQGKLSPVIDSTFRLTEARQAHERLEGDHIGKIILTI